MIDNLALYLMVVLKSCTRRLVNVLNKSLKKKTGVLQDHTRRRRTISVRITNVIKLTYTFSYIQWTLTFIGPSI